MAQNAKQGKTAPNKAVTKTTVAKQTTLADAEFYSRLGYGRLAENEGSLTPICNVLEACGPDGSFGFTENNLRKAKLGKVNICIKFKNADGVISYIPTSTNISTMLLSGEMNLSSLAGCLVQETEDEDDNGNKRLIITLPQQGRDSMVNATDITVTAIEFSDDWVPDNLLEF